LDSGRLQLQVPGRHLTERLPLPQGDVPLLEGALVAAYGAAAKGNTLMNFAGVKRDLVAFVTDRNPAKQGKYMPGSRIPIVAEERIRESRPKYIVILPWNLKAELKDQLAYVSEWNARVLVALPRLTFLT